MIESARVAFFAERDVGLNLAISYSQGMSLNTLIFLLHTFPSLKFFL